MQILHEGRTALLRDLESLATGQRWDALRLRRLETASRALGKVADSLLIFMIEHDLADALLDDAERLFDFFQATEMEVAAKLGPRARTRKAL